LKSQILITAGERNVACGSKTDENLPERQDKTNKILPFSPFGQRPPVQADVEIVLISQVVDLRL
jgi:hypothetical protein